VAVAVLAAVTGCDSGSVHVVPPEPAGAVRQECARLVNYLPPTLDGNGSRVVDPRSPLVHAWGSPPIVMRCGVPTPPGFDPSSAQVARVDGVRWFQYVGTDTVTWTAVRRIANVELVVPKAYQGQGGLLVELGTAIRKTIQ
jgi:hypothetical protein